MSFLNFKDSYKKSNITLIENVFFSVLSQGLNYIFPLIILPHLVRTLGIEGFGSVTFIQNITNYFITVIIFGFHLTGTNDIAQQGENLIKRNQIFHEILFARLCLFFICFIILIAAISYVDRLTQSPFLFLMSFLTAFGWVFQSEFFFQGIQKMGFLTAANILSRFIALIIIFVGVQTTTDVDLAILGYGIGGVLGGIFCFLIAYSKYKLQWYIPSWQSIWDKVTSSYHVFLSAMAVNLYSSNINLLILGLVTNTLLVGYYSIADRIFILICATSIPINQALFPFLSKLAANNYPKYLRFIKKFILVITLIYTIAGLLLYIIAPFLVLIISGKTNQESVELLRILCFSLPFYQFGSIYTNVFIIHHQKKYIPILNGTLVFINLSLIYPFLQIWGMSGLAYINLITYISMLLIGFYIIKTKKIFQPILTNIK